MAYGVPGLLRSIDAEKHVNAPLFRFGNGLDEFLERKPLSTVENGLAVAVRWIAVHDIAAPCHPERLPIVELKERRAPCSIVPDLDALSEPLRRHRSVSATRR